MKSLTLSLGKKWAKKMVPIAMAQAAFAKLKFEHPGHRALVGQGRRTCSNRKHRVPVNLFFELPCCSTFVFSFYIYIYLPGRLGWCLFARKQDLETMSTTQIHRKLRKVGWRMEAQGWFEKLLWVGSWKMPRMPCVKTWRMEEVTDFPTDHWWL